MEGRGEADIRKSVFEQLSERRITLLGMKGAEMSLEEIFLQLTDGSKEIAPIIDRAPVKRVHKSELEAAQADTEEGTQNVPDKEESK